MFETTNRAMAPLAAFLAIVFSAVEVAADDGVNQITTVHAGDRGAAAVAKIDPEGTIHVLYDRADGPQYATTRDHGKTFSVAIPVVDAGARKIGLEYYVSDMAVGPGGRVHVVMNTNAWKLKLPQEEWGLQFASLKPGEKVFSAVRNVNHKPSEGFSLAADERGNVTACWLSGRLYANISHDNGETFSSSVEINPAYDPCNCCTTSTAYGADGRLAVLYREETNNERDMYLVQWDQTSEQTSRTRISSTLWKIDACPMSAFAISRNRDGFAAVWPTKDQIYFARLGPTGAPLPPGEIKTPGVAGMHTGMLALSAPSGATLVTWKNNGRLSWQLYDAGGRSLGSVGSAKSSSNGVAGVVEEDGKFLLFQ